MNRLQQILALVLYYFQRRWLGSWRRAGRNRHHTLCMKKKTQKPCANKSGIRLNFAWFCIVITIVMREVRPLHWMSKCFLWVIVLSFRVRQHNEPSRSTSCCISCLFMQIISKLSQYMDKVSIVIFNRQSLFVKGSRSQQEFIKVWNEKLCGIRRRTLEAPLQFFNDF